MKILECVKYQFLIMMKIIWNWWKNWL